MKKPGKGTHFRKWNRDRKVTGGRLLMEKIVLVSREPGNHDQMISLMEALFPECTVEVVSGTGAKLNLTSTPLKREMDPCSGRYATRGD